MKVLPADTIANMTYEMSAAHSPSSVEEIVLTEIEGGDGHEGWKVANAATRGRQQTDDGEGNGKVDEYMTRRRESYSGNTEIHREVVDTARGRKSHGGNMEIQREVVDTAYGGDDM